MEFVVLGAGSTAPHKKRSVSGHLLLLDQANILLDGGSGTCGRLLQAGGSLFDLTHIFYTHLHTDHVGDMAPILFTIRNTPGRGRRPTLDLVGPPGFLDYFESMRRLSGEGSWWTMEDCRLRPSEIDTGKRDFGCFTLEAFVMNHMGGRARGYRITDASGLVVAYSGDTGPCEALTRLGHEADLFVLECSFPDDEAREGHMTPSRCAEVAREAMPAHLVLVHRYPACDRIDVAREVKSRYDGKVTVAEDGDRFPVG